MSSARTIDVWETIAREAAAESSLWRDALKPENALGNSAWTGRGLVEIAVEVMQELADRYSVRRLGAANRAVRRIDHREAASQLNG